MGKIVDSFAGGGGASQAIFMATGKHPDIAINHNETALSMHRANHPTTRHLSKNIWQVDPLDEVKKGEVDIAWFSPDCTHFSRAKGRKPLKKNLRDLAWTIVLWAQRVRPKVIFMENVTEWLTWGPLDADGRPDQSRAGETFKEWRRALLKEGYAMEFFELRACDFGAPTIRKRVFGVIRCDNMPIVKPRPTHGHPLSEEVLSGELLPYETAADQIDWSLPCPSIFDTRAEIKEKYGVTAIRPLADNTLKRVARGIEKYVLSSSSPFIVPITHSKDQRVEPIDEPLRTTTCAKGGERMIAVPTLMQYYGNGSGSKDRFQHPESPLLTTTTANRHALVTAFMAQHNTGAIGRPMSEPLSTITLRGTQQQIVSAHLLSLKGSARRSVGIDRPHSAICAQGGHSALIAAFMTKYYGEGTGARISEPLHTITSIDKLGIVTANISGDLYALQDIGMRMLTPRELFRCQGFSDDYIIDVGHDGKEISKTDQVSCCGNSVSPWPAMRLIQANCQNLIHRERAA